MRYKRIIDFVEEVLQPSVNWNPEIHQGHWNVLQEVHAVSSKHRRKTQNRFGFQNPVPARCPLSVLEDRRRRS